MRSLLMTFIMGLVGCSHHSTVSDAIHCSASFRRAYSINPIRARWFVDRMDGRYAVVYMGFDEGTHYTRLATLRVRERGVVEREVLRDDGELIWIPDE